MGPIDFNCPNFGRIYVVGDRLHNGHDFAVRSNTRSKVFDYLIFLDSRGISSKFEGSIADKLTSTISQMQGTYLLICRPLELTIWASLSGFLENNRLKPRKIITNMGFVDFTPKKISILQDVVLQVENVVGKGVAQSVFVENFNSSSGESIALYSSRYNNHYKAAVEKISQARPLVIINTPRTDPSIAILRKRPQSFFYAQLISNEFNRSISDAVVVDLPDFDESLTYDAVHYTQQGNEVIFSIIQEYL